MASEQGWAALQLNKKSKSKNRFADDGGDYDPYAYGETNDDLAYQDEAYGGDFLPSAFSFLKSEFIR